MRSLRCWWQQGRWSEGSQRPRGSQRGSARRGDANGEICEVVVAWSSSYRPPESLLRTGSSSRGRSAQNRTQSSAKSCQQDEREEKKKNGTRGGRGEHGVYQNGR
jgi:hypothetical protein